MPEGVSYSLFPASADTLQRQRSTTRIRSRTPSRDAPRRSNSSRANGDWNRPTQLPKTELGGLQRPHAVVSLPSSDHNASAHAIEVAKQPVKRRSRSDSRAPREVSSPSLYAPQTPQDSTVSLPRGLSRSISARSHLLPAQKAPPRIPLPDLPPITSSSLRRKNSSCSLNSMIVDSPIDPGLPDMMSSSACSSSTPSLAVSNTTARTSVSAVPTKMTPPLQTAPAFSPADTELAASPAYTASSTTYPITYPSVPMRLSSPVSVSPQRSLTRSPRRTTTPHRAHGSDATSATLVSPSEKSVDNGLSTLHEAFASTTRPGTAPSENCQRRPKEEERGFQSIFPDYDPDLPLTRQHCQPAYKPAVYQKAPSSSARDFATGPRSRTPKMSSSSTMSRSPGFPQKTAVIAEQEIPTFAPPPMKPLRGSVKRKEKKGKDGSKSFTFMQRSDSVGPVKDKPARARLVKKSRPTTTTCNATSTASSSSKVATSTGQTISSPVMTITNTQVEDIDQQTQRSSTDTKTTSQRPTFSLTPATDPKPKGYEPSNAGTMSLVQPVRQYIPVPGGKLQPLPEGHKYAEEQQMVVHGVTVALGALAFVAGVGVEMGAGVLGKVGKRV